MAAMVQFCSRMDPMRPQFILQLRLRHFRLRLRPQDSQILAAWRQCGRNFSYGYGCGTFGYGRCQSAAIRLRPHDKKAHAVVHYDTINALQI